MLLLIFLWLFLLLLLAAFSNPLADFEQSAAAFATLHAAHACSLSGMDFYSNVLYIMAESATLSHLAHWAVLLHPLTPVCF